MQWGFHHGLLARAFTLVEALVATGVLAIVLGATFQVLAPSQGIFRVQPEVVDLHQRLRVAIEALAADLRSAGAGPRAGPLAGSLGRVIAPVLPTAGRAGTRAAAGYRPDAISIVRTPPAGAQARLAGAVSAGATRVELDANPCPDGRRDLCGFREDASALLVREDGAWELTRVARVAPQAQRLELEGGLARGYAAGSTIVEVVARAYWLEAAGPVPALIRSVNGGAAFPVVDHVVGLRFDYWSKRDVLQVPPSGDADFLRVALVRVTLRVQVASPEFRGPAGLSFARAGTATSAASLVPDREVRFDVTLRNAGAGP